MTHKVMCIIKLLRIIKFLFFITTPAHIEMNVLFYEILIATKRKNIRSRLYKLRNKGFSLPLAQSARPENTHTHPHSQVTSYYHRCFNDLGRELNGKVTFYGTLSIQENNRGKKYFHSLIKRFVVTCAFTTILTF